MPTFDIERLTAFTESSPRTQTIDTLQYHHAATTSLAALEDNMEPGGRQVSANAALDSDGTLILKVPLNRRAFTSATSFDHRSLTVETVNTSGDPEWGISDASHRRIGRLAAEMYREGMLQGLFYGPGGIIGHKDVPGTYATACPGPSYNADLILKYAGEFLTKPTTPTAQEDDVRTYITDGSRWALLDPLIPGGYEVTNQVAVAEGFSMNMPVAAPRTVTVKQFDQGLVQAKKLYDGAKSERTVTIGDVNVAGVKPADFKPLADAIILAINSLPVAVATAINTDTAKRLAK